MDNMSGLSFILLGSNLGDRKNLVERAIELIELRCGNVVMKSRQYESEPWGFEAEYNFINQVIVVKTEMFPHDLLTELLSIESELGRQRHENVIGYESRPIDLDILYYDDLVINDENLILPHPRIHLRKFALLPLCDVASDFIHPIFDKSNKILLEECDDNSIVNICS